MMFYYKKSEVQACQSIKYKDELDINMDLKRKLMP